MKCSSIPEDAWYIPRVTLRKGRRPVVYHSAALRTALAEAQNWRCCYCHTTLDPEGQHGPTPTLEHVVAIAVGGSDTPDNMAIACKPCNSKRGHDDAYSYRPSFSRFYR
jgi:5-methylcytosine-specific restriction endonuclease McrA